MKIAKLKIENYKKGFTLIELLIVIAIIGILSAIILSALGNSRNKANDSKTKQNLTRIRTAAQLYFTNNNGAYTLSSMNLPANPCTGTMFLDGPSGMNAYTGTASAWPQNVLLSCQASASAYAVSANLLVTGLSAATDHWCVDSTGASKAIDAQLISGDTVC